MSKLRNLFRKTHPHIRNRCVDIARLTKKELREAYNAGRADQSSIDGYKDFKDWFKSTYGKKE
jgi:hypothetical protein